ncbi:hypothetical protein FHETE_9590 [Fusarium heterosporum]|uniref:Uncharacterized protein n=1 Tax=Fusarium heterosporum TaxID=42747 RepID=A0A8H5SSI6_FUSHE|nr:hypothetical protein FHETE_9590 [Fusarium heterosporum]
MSDYQHIPGSAYPSVAPHHAQEEIFWPDLMPDTCDDLTGVYHPSCSNEYHGLPATRTEETVNENYISGHQMKQFMAQDAPNSKKFLSNQSSAGVQNIASAQNLSSTQSFPFAQNSVGNQNLVSAQNIPSTQSSSYFQNSPSAQDVPYAQNPFAMRRFPNAHSSEIEGCQIPGIPPAMRLPSSRQAHDYHRGLQNQQYQEIHQNHEEIAQEQLSFAQEQFPFTQEQLSDSTSPDSGSHELRDSPDVAMSQTLIIENETDSASEPEPEPELKGKAKYKKVKANSRVELSPHVLRALNSGDFTEARVNYIKSTLSQFSQELNDKIPEYLLYKPNHDDKASRSKYLIVAKDEGLSYKQILALGEYTCTESTLRGRHRVLVRPASERPRRPAEWSLAQKWAAMAGFYRLYWKPAQAAGLPLNKSNIRWSLIGEDMRAQGVDHCFDGHAISKAVHKLAAEVEAGLAGFPVVGDNY